MVFDETISVDVPLSKVLDALIIDNEEPSVILSFLKQHDHQFADILKYSLYCNRLFQLDFFLKCNDECREYVINKLKEVSINDAAFLTWQVLRSNSGKVQSIKYRFRKELNWILKNGPRHPYSGTHQKYIADFDSLILKAAENDTINDVPLNIDNRKLTSFFKNLSYSLFQKRILQYDFFANLDDLSKYFFMHNVLDSTCDMYALKMFVLQLLDSNEDVEVKKECFSILYNKFNLRNIIDQDVFKVINDCKSFSEMMLKLTIFNADVTQTVILYLLLYEPVWLVEWEKFDKDDLNSILNISELVEALFMNKK